jgi:hypothetical protein
MAYYTHTPRKKEKNIVCNEENILKSKVYSKRTGVVML